MEKKDNEGQRLTRVSDMTGEVGGVDACQVSSIGVKIRGFYARSLECKGEGIEPAGPTISLYMLYRQYSI